jgi:hypothetical protein
MATENNDRNTNLARIRDNQRRSRQRRKEYLQELETKYRVCEQTGVEATAEVQKSARKVIDENIRLRQLLKQHGISDAEIEKGNAAADLEGMLGVKKCCASPTSNHQQHQQWDLDSPARLLKKSSTGSSSDTTTQYHDLQPEVVSYHTHEFPQQWQGETTVGTYAEAPLSVPSNATFSCDAAAAFIRGKRPELGIELEQDLGCASGCAPGQSCVVSDNHVFQVLDKYSGGGAG